LEDWKIFHTPGISFCCDNNRITWIDSATKGDVLGSVSTTFKSVYGFAIGATFTGVIGVGFYPIFRSRVWCRFGCPMAAVLGIIQKCFSRFKITVNGNQCISCGKCSTYCEMGIDVKSYAQYNSCILCWLRCLFGSLSKRSFKIRKRTNRGKI